MNWQYSGGTLRDLRSNPKRVCCLGLACLFLAFLIAHSSTLANEQTPDPDAYEIVAVDADIDLRLIAQKYLNNPDLWPVVLQLNGLEDIDELASVQQLRLPVGPLSAAASALRRSLEAIQSANEAGAQLFAPQLVSKAIQLREEAVGEKNVGKYDSSISLSAKSITNAGTAKQESEKNRDVGGEALLQDRQGWVEGQKAAETSWSDRKINSILTEQEKLRTLSQSTAQVVFRDASKLRLNPNSQAVIQRMRVDKLSRRAEAKISLVQGDFYALLTPESKRNRLEVTLPSAEATIDSGNFWVSQDSKVAKFSNYDAKPVSITASGETLVLGRNEGALVEAGTAPRQKVSVQDSINLIAPDDEAVVFNNQVDLTWQPSKGANAYWAELAKDPRFDKMSKSLWGLKSNRADQVELTPGVYYWRVAVLDEFGLPGQMSVVRKFEIRTDTAPPFLKLDTPVDGKLHRKADLKIEGETERDANLFVQGEKVKLDTNGRFVTTIAVTPGENSIEVKSVDRAGNETVRTRTVKVILDKKSDIVFAENVPRNSEGTFLSAGRTLTLEGTVVADARIQIFGSDNDLKSETFTSADGKFAVNIPLRAEQESLMLKVTTQSNYAYEETISAKVLDTPPRIKLADPVPRYTSKKELAIALSVDQEATITVNGEPARREGDQIIASVALLEGANNLEIIATNAVGLSTIEKRKTILDTLKPEVTARKLTIQKRGKRQFATIRIGAKDASGLAKTSKVVVRSGNEISSGFLRFNRARKSYNGRIEAPPRAEGASYQVLVELIDVAGNINLVELIQ